MRAVINTIMGQGIMMLVNEFPPLPVGGAERQAERLATWLASHGWQVSVLTRGESKLSLFERRDGFSVYRILSFGKNKLSTIAFLFGLLWKLFQYRENYAILHAHLAFGPAFVATVVARLLKKRVIVKLGNSGQFGDINVSQKTIRGRIRLFFLRKFADAIIVLDNVMLAEAVSAGFSEYQLRRINNGITLDLFTKKESRNSAKALLGLSGKTVILFMGRLTPQKSISTLFKAFALARKECTDLHLLVLGDGPMKDELNSMASALDISDHVTMAGAHSDVRPYLSGSDIFALPSISEGISNALLEAMSAGLVCVASSVGGNVEVLGNGNYGILVPKEDVTAWAAVFLQLGRAPEFREKLGVAATSRIREVYDFSIVGYQYIKLYNELLNE